MRQPLQNRRLGRYAEFIRAVLGDRAGNVSAVMALLLVPIIGALAMATEATSWALTQRAMQNAADSAVLAAARNGCVSGASCNTTRLQPDYITEARSVTAKMSYVHASNNVDVAVVNNATCPGGGSCYQVTITKKVPVYLLGVVGFSGDTTLPSGALAKNTTAIAMAKVEEGTPFCITALSSDTQAIDFRGASRLDLTGCSLATNGGASCNAHTGETIPYAYVHDAGQANKDCGSEQVTGTAYGAAPWDALASNIPSPPCGAANPTNYPQAPRNGGSKDVVDSAHTITTPGAVNGSFCGDVKLGGNVTLTSDSTLIIYNGRLDLAGHTLAAGANTHLTVIMSGHQLTSGSFSPDHQIMSSVIGGAIDFAAPTSGTWSGVAFYQDPVLNGAKNNIDHIVSGNNPQFNITGLWFAPNANVEMFGAINHATEGEACIAFVVDQLLNAGTGALFANPTRFCDRAGLSNLAKVKDRAVLVQ